MTSATAHAIANRLARLDHDGAIDVQAITVECWEAGDYYVYVQGWEHCDRIDHVTHIQPVIDRASR